MFSRTIPTGFPSTALDDNGVDVVEGTSAITVKLYFDKKSGLLVRSVRYTEDGDRLQSHGN